MTIEEFPHISNNLVAMWGTMECRQYIISLGVIERTRPYRHGFSEDAFHDIVLLYYIHDDVFPQFAVTHTVGDSWNNITSSVDTNTLASFEALHKHNIRII